MKIEMALTELAGWLLMLGGSLLLLLLLITVPIDDEAFDFTGLVCIFIGFALLELDIMTHAYRFLLFLALAVGLPAATIAVIQSLAVFTQVSIAADIPVNAVSVLGENALPLCGMALFVAALHHPDTRSHFSRKKYNSDPRTLYLPPRRLALVGAATLLFVAIGIRGAWLFPSRDMYAAAIESIRSDDRVKAAVGDVQSLVLLSSSYSADYLDASWKVLGAAGEESCRTAVSDSLVATVQLGVELGTKAETGAP